MSCGEPGSRDPERSGARGRQAGHGCAFIPHDNLACFRRPGPCDGRSEDGRMGGWALARRGPGPAGFGVRSRSGQVAGSRPSLGPGPDTVQPSLSTRMIRWCGVEIGGRMCRTDGNAVRLFLELWHSAACPGTVCSVPPENASPGAVGTVDNSPRVLARSLQPARSACS